MAHPESLSTIVASRPTSVARRCAVAAFTSLLVWAAGTAAAAPVLAGSSYAVYVEGDVSHNVRNLSTLFDGLAEAPSGTGITVSENQTDLGGGRWLITIDLSSGGVDLFPAAGEGARVGVGTLGDGLDLIGSWYLEDARHSYSAPGGFSFTTGNLANDYRTQYFSGNWDGAYPHFNRFFVNGNAGGRGIDAVRFNFVVSEVPEPGVMWLSATGLMLLAWRHRKSA